ncbi:hypothetical protein BHE74_00015878 [Ensete ventricosum]|nr:hypothetical protein BHE74_00015878 [Ensete ventricosum]
MQCTKGSHFMQRKWQQGEGKKETPSEAPRCVLKCFGLLLLLVLLVCSSLDGCEARKGKRWRRKSPSSSLARKKTRGKSGGGGHNHGGGGGSGGHTSPPPSSNQSPCPVTGSPTATFDVLDFGAKGDGVTDDTKAFEDAWAAACKVEGSTVVVPAEFEFLVGPISFSGPYCQPNIVFQALRFYGSYNVTVTGITIQNSPQCHLKFDNCEAAQVFNVTIASPGSSPNTDGIHLQNSRDVMIHHTNMSCGKSSTSPVRYSLVCRLDHPKTPLLTNDMHLAVSNGCHHESSQGGSGSAQSIRFSNIRVTEVQTPIVIDQFYCDKSSCKNQTSAVALSGIGYEYIKGTYTVKPVHFACSDTSPCSDISLTGVELKPLQEQYHMYQPFCWQTFGELYTPTIPPIVCLQNGKPAGNRILSDRDVC